MLAETFGAGAAPIVIQRTTGAYHGYMALILFAGYFGAILWNLRHEKREEQFPLGWLLAIGIFVQFGWEAALLLGGIRSAGFASYGDKLMTLIINSLLETNLGLPYVYALFLLYSAKRTERLTKRRTPLRFTEALAENNRLRVNREPKQTAL